ncbi:hypothetical protein O181_044303, partial [Austropuccinia psidii MF-1]|nr:hypothetical protein [Austropuccinia psidii MF-1]
MQASQREEPVPQGSRGLGNISAQCTQLEESARKSHREIELSERRTKLEYEFKNKELEQRQEKIDQELVQKQQKINHKISSASSAQHLEEIIRLRKEGMSADEIETYFHVAFN